MDSKLRGAIMVNNSMMLVDTWPCMHALFFSAESTAEWIILRGLIKHQQLEWNLHFPARTGGKIEIWCVRRKKSRGFAPWWQLGCGSGPQGLVWLVLTAFVLHYTRAPTRPGNLARPHTLLIIIIIITVIMYSVLHIYLPFLQMKSPGEKSTGRRRSTSSHKKPASVFWKISTRFKVSRCTLMAISAFSLSETRVKMHQKICSNKRFLRTRLSCYWASIRKTLKHL